MMHRAKRGVLARRAERELMKVGLADEDCSRLSQASDDWSVGLGDIARQHPRRGGGRLAGDVDEVLD